MRVGIMGGTLDPVHNGHILIAREAARRFGLDRVMLLPAGDPPHKTPPVSKEDRMMMARLAAREYESEGFFACGIEIAREGTTYTVDTLRWLRDNNPGVEWYYLIGADTVDVIDSWRSFDEVARLCRFIACGRAESPVSEARVEYLNRRYGAEILVSSYNGPDISSTQLRNRVNRGQGIGEFVPPAVDTYIAEHGLYLSPMSEGEIHAALRETLKPSRYEHTLGVVQTAEALCGRYGIPRGRAHMAALLHDCAKYVPDDELRALVRRAYPDADEAELAATAVLHAPGGAYLAQTRFGVNDPAILQAIRRHTLGAEDMTALDALIYVCDFIEPNRPAFRGIEAVRAAARRDIFEAAYLCAYFTGDYLMRQGRQSHPRTLEMMRRLKSYIDEKGDRHHDGF